MNITTISGPLQIMSEEPVALCFKPVVWHDVVVPHHLNQQLERIETAINNVISRGAGKTEPLNVLLWGAPGVGKTAIQLAFARLKGVHCIATNVLDFRAGYIGQGAQRTREIFLKARAAAPAIVLIDEFEYLLPSRDSRGYDSFGVVSEVICEFLCQLDELSKARAAVFIIAETFEPKNVDAAILSRDFVTIEVPRPDEACRAEILRRWLRGVPTAPDLNIDEVCTVLANRLDSKTGRDLATLVLRAMQRAAGQASAPDRRLTRELLMAELSTWRE